MSGRLLVVRENLQMDAAYFDELSGRVRALYIAVVDRLPKTHSDLVSEFLDHAEYGLAVEWMAARLAETQATLTDDELSTFRGHRRTSWAAPPVV
jgi:hypothetical protein